MSSMLMMTIKKIVVHCTSTHPTHENTIDSYRVVREVEAVTSHNPKGGHESSRAPSQQKQHAKARPTESPQSEIVRESR